MTRATDLDTTETIVVRDDATARAFITIVRQYTETTKLVDLDEPWVDEDGDEHYHDYVTVGGWDVRITRETVFYPTGNQRPRYEKATLTDETRMTETASRVFFDESVKYWQAKAV